MYLSHVFQSINRTYILYMMYYLNVETKLGYKVSVVLIERDKMSPLGVSNPWFQVIIAMTNRKHKFKENYIIYSDSGVIPFTY